MRRKLYLEEDEIEGAPPGGGGRRLKAARELPTKMTFRSDVFRDFIVLPGETAPYESPDSSARQQPLNFKPAVLVYVF
jgi:hypothetical protein